MVDIKKSVTVEEVLNTIIDGGADTSMLNNKFKVILQNYYETVNVGGCIDGMVEENGVIAYDKDNDSTILVVVNNIISLSQQSTAILSTN